MAVNTSGGKQGKKGKKGGVPDDVGTDRLRTAGSPPRSSFVGPTQFMGRIQGFNHPSRRTEG